MDNSIKTILGKRLKNGTYRSLTQKQHLVDFCSNDYLGLAQHSFLKKAIINGLQKLPVLGATGSRLITGNHNIHETLEAELATFFDAEAALLFSSGYTANAGLIPTLARKSDLIVYDELIHASLHDGIRLSKADSLAFKHNNLQDLEHVLKAPINGKKFIVVESIYSMDGDTCPLVEIVELSKKYNAYIVLDEAHSTGMYTKGKGLACHLGLQKDIYTRVHTFGKAIGYHGAVIVGNQLLKDYLVNYCRPFIYTTAPPPHFVETLRIIFKTLPSIHQQKWQKLLTNIKHFKLLAESLGIITVEPNGFIQSIIIGNAEKAKKLSAYLEEKGFYVKAIVSPTVAKRQERLRVCLHSFNTFNEIEALCKATKSGLAD